MSSTGTVIVVPTMCVRDDEAKTFEFRWTGSASETVARVSAALARGRQVRCYTLRGDREAIELEERYLAGRGYRRASVAGV